MRSEYCEDLLTFISVEITLGVEGLTMGVDFDDEELTCSACGETKRVQIRLGDFHHYTDCEAGEAGCLLIRDVIESHTGSDIDVSVSQPD